MSVNRVILIGNVGQDPRVKYFDTGSAVATFPLATTDRGYTLQNGTQIPERTEWHNIVASNRLAEIVDKYVHKGDKLYLEGKIRTRSYSDQSGAMRYITEIYVDNMEMLTPKGLAKVRALLHNRGLQHRHNSRSKCNKTNSRSSRRRNLYKITRQTICRSKYCDNVSIG